ncbi:hypothetical protein GRF29_28g1538354, partial [Pseudopithomyces chartarum]
MEGFTPEEIAYETSHQNEDRGGLLIAISSVFTAAAVLCFIIRIVARRISQSRINLDDYLSLGATISLIGVYTSALLTAKYGIGKHVLIVAQDPENFVNIGKSTIVLGIFYTLSMTLGKLSVLAFLNRIFSPSNRAIQIGVWIFSIYTIAWAIAQLLVYFLECRPLSSNWGVPYQCVPPTWVWPTLGILNIVSDVGILVLPQLKIMRLHFSLPKKIGLCFVFMIGGLATGVSIARIPLFINANGADSVDFT